MDPDEKLAVIQDLSLKIGSDIKDISAAYHMEKELISKREELQKCLNEVTNEVPTKLSLAIEKAESNILQIESFKEKREDINSKISKLLNNTEPLRNELNKRFETIHKLEQAMVYLKSFEKIEDLCVQLKQCNDDEQATALYSELKLLYLCDSKGHKGAYIKDCMHYWHNILKDKYTKQYEDVLKTLKWPFTSTQDSTTTPPAKELLTKFSVITRYLLLIEEPRSPGSANLSGDFSLEYDPCLPIKILLNPLKKRFQFHFAGSRPTARLDRPEWFLTQTLTWIKDHKGFIKKNVQPVADKLDMKHIRAEDEFNNGLICLAAERLHTVLGLYYMQGFKGDMLDVDAAFAHAIDETLGFHKELVAMTGKDANSVISVLTKAETFVRWLAVEKKYAVAKLDEMLSCDSWMEVAGGWVPRGADWAVCLLDTLQQRYQLLPQPGHRLQFLELQLELIEEWRAWLLQLLGAARSLLTEDSFLVCDETPHPLTAVINAAHHTRTVLLQKAHSLHYLQLHYYRRQFQHFTQQQHQDESQAADDTTDNDVALQHIEEQEKEQAALLSLQEVEARAKALAIEQFMRKPRTDDSVLKDISSPRSETSNMADFTGTCDTDDSGVFGEAPNLLASLRDTGLTVLADHMLLEFKAGLRDYKKQKWHAMPVVESVALSISSSLCRPLAGLCARLLGASAKLAPPLHAKLRANVANEVDTYIFEEVVLESWWNTGGMIQFNHDVTRNLIPAFSPPNKLASSLCLLPKLKDALFVLNMDYGDGNHVRRWLAENSDLKGLGLTDDYAIQHITAKQVDQILNQRTDLSKSSVPRVVEVF